MRPPLLRGPRACPVATYPGANEPQMNAPCGPAHTPPRPAPGRREGAGYCVSEICQLLPQMLPQPTSEYFCGLST
jgi:hypothetical protein